MTGIGRRDAHPRRRTRTAEPDTNAHEDLLRSLLVERYRLWRPDAAPALTPEQQLVRGLAREKPRKPSDYREKQRRTQQTKGARTT